MLHVPLVLALGGLSPDAPPPQPIVGGTDAAVCEWPATVMMLEADETPVMCSGSLIAPDVVLTAAHCLIPERPIVAIGFGEAGQVFGTPAFTVAPTECVQHPDYAQFGVTDVAYCRLAEPVTTVPIVPLLAGCEVDVLQSDVEVTIVGFGATWGTYDEEQDAVVTMGVGAKRHTTQTIDYVDEDQVEVNLLGADGSQSACFGDSGGPALVELDDGTWRVFGAGSHLYDPGGFPGPMEPGNICGVGVAYSYVPPTIAWLESQTGVDLTPCWDGDAYVDGCGESPSAPGVAAGAWKNGCSGGPTAGGAPTCEPVGSESGGEESTGGGSSDGGVDSTGAASTGTDGGNVDTTTDATGATDAMTTAGDSASASATAGSTAPTTNDPSETGDDGTDGSSTGTQDQGGGGCGCGQSPSDARWLWGAGLLWLPVARRRSERRSRPIAADGGRRGHAPRPCVRRPPPH